MTIMDGFHYKSSNTSEINKMEIRPVKGTPNSTMGLFKTKVLITLEWQVECYKQAQPQKGFKQNHF